jgi:hypothetical protein
MQVHQQQACLHLCVTTMLPVLPLLGWNHAGLMLSHVCIAITRCLSPVSCNTTARSVMPQQLRPHAPHSSCAYNSQHLPRTAYLFGMRYAQSCVALMVGRASQAMVSSEATPV